VRTLRYVNYLRQELGLERKGHLRVELRSTDGKSTKMLDLPLAERPPVFGTWPAGVTRTLPGHIGYLRIESMEEGTEFVRGLHQAMAGLRDTKGLIIDVRGNGGGSRDAVRELFPYFMTDKDAPRVANVAAYRLGEGDKPDAPEGYLEDRFLYPLASKRWTAEERKAIAELAVEFQPEWNPPAGEFSAWHYFLISPRKGEAYYHYDKPVVVLLNGDCFSATDIFLGAFKGWRNVTLIGTPSGGGSGRAIALTLRNSAIGVRLSSMASFQSDGRLYDGRGVEPDLLVQPAANDWAGKADTALNAAMKRLE
jgi:C-terminal processing protease CtpA/Prc